MKFKQFLKEEVTGTDGLTIYHTKVFKPKGWDMDLQHFFNALPETFKFLSHVENYNLHRFKPRINKSHLGEFDNFKKNVLELKYDSGKLVGVTVNLKNLHNSPDFKDEVQKGKVAMMDVTAGQGRKIKELKDDKGDVIYQKGDDGEDLVADLKIDPKHSYTYSISDILKDEKGKRDWATWKKVGEIKTIHPVDGPLTWRAGDYSKDPNKGKVVKGT